MGFLLPITHLFAPFPIDFGTGLVPNFPFSGTQFFQPFFIGFYMPLTTLMSKNNISILVWLYKTKINKKGLSPVCIRISYGSQRKTIATGHTISVDRWDSTKSRVKGSTEEAQQINEYLQSTRVRFINLFNEMLKEVPGRYPPPYGHFHVPEWL